MDGEEVVVDTELVDKTKNLENWGFSDIDIEYEVF